MQYSQSPFFVTYFGLLALCGIVGSKLQEKRCAQEREIEKVRLGNATPIGYPHRIYTVVQECADFLTVPPHRAT